MKTRDCLVIAQPLSLGVSQTEVGLKVWTTCSRRHGELRVLRASRSQCVRYGQVVDTILSEVTVITVSPLSVDVGPVTVTLCPL